MGSINHEEKCKLVVNNLDEKQSQKVTQLMRTRPTFYKYIQQLDNYDSSKDLGSLLKSTINNEIELNELNHILLHTGHDKIAIQIDKSLKDLCDLKQCDPKLGYKEKFSFGHPNLKDSLDTSREQSSSNSTGLYVLALSPRGLCILINNYFTIGTYKELQRFRNIFFQLHFDVIMEKNLLNSEIEALLKNLPNKYDLSKHSAFVFMIITSGNEKKQIIDSENQSLDILKLTKILDDPIFTHLNGKPKLLFFNCCCEDPNESTSANWTDSFPVSDHWFFCHSSLEKSIDWQNGTEFGQKLADSLRKKAFYKDIDAIMTITKYYLKKKFDMRRLIVLSELHSRLFFNPTCPYLRPYYSKSTLKAFIEDEKNIIDDKNLTELIEQLCKRLKYMHDKGIIHSNINPENIKISFPDENEKIKVMEKDFEGEEIQSNNNSISGQSKSGFLCWKAPEVFNELNDSQDFEGTKENDIFSLGCVIYFVITRGKHPFGKNFINIAIKDEPKLNNLNNDWYIIYTDLIRAMISYDKTKRPSIAYVVNHPVFWALNKTQKYFMTIHDQLQNKNKGNVNYEISKEKIIDIKNKLKTKENVVFGTDWLDKLCPVVYSFEKGRQERDESYQVRDSNSIFGLIKYVRDKASHPIEWPLQKKSSEDIVGYLIKKFPLLLIHTYNAFEEAKSFEVLKEFYNCL